MKSTDIEVSSLFKALAIKLEEFEQGQLNQCDQEAILLISACSAIFWHFKNDLKLTNIPSFDFSDKSQFKALHEVINSVLSQHNYQSGATEEAVKGATKLLFNNKEAAEEVKNLLFDDETKE